MVSFSNIYPVTLDGKGRVVLPSPFKKEMGETLEPSFVVEKDVYDKCLNIYPHTTWLAKVERLRRKLNPDDPIQSKMLSRYYEEIVKVGMAENGRLNIPDEMLKYAGITKEAVFTGQGSRMRLWEPSRHQASRLSDEDYARLYRELLGGSMDTFNV
jgi:MraZ protein